MNFLPFAIALLFVVAHFIPVAQGSVAVTSDAAGRHDVPLPFCLGYVFSVSEQTSVKALGQFDVAADGFSNGAKVSLFNWDTGEKLVEIGLSGALLEETGFYDTHFVAIRPVALRPGIRYLIATEVAANDFAYGNAMMTMNSVVQWQQGRSTTSSNPAMPATANGSTFPIERTTEDRGSYFGPNMKIGNSSPSSGIVIAHPSSRNIIQRSSTNTGDVPIAGSFLGIPDEIQARAVVMEGAAYSGESTDWQTIATVPTGGLFSGILRNVPAGGWYQIEVRAVNSGQPGTSSVISKIGIGDIYITCGQSNSANYGQGGFGASDDRVCARTSVTQSTWVRAIDPLPIAGGSGGSVWSRLGDMLASEQNIPIGFLSIGVGSTQVAEWLPSSPHYINLLRPALRSLPANGFRAILWHQGESDSIAQTSAETYASRLRSIIQQSRLDAAWSVPWYVSEASFHPATTLSQEEPVAAGQRLVIQSDPLVFIGPSTDDFHAEDANGGKLIDTVHFNNTGLLDHAQQWRDILLRKSCATVKNGGFEDNCTPSLTNRSSLADGAAHVVNTTSDLDSPSVIGWRILNAQGTAAADGTNGFHNPAAQTYAFAVDAIKEGVLPRMMGRHVAMLDGGTAGNQFFSQTREFASARKKYTLTVAIGVRDDPSSYGIARLEITVNDQTVATARFPKSTLDSLHGGNSSGSFTDASVTWTTGANVEQLSPLGIRIVKENGAGTCVDFDHVRLTVQPSDDFSSWIKRPSRGITAETSHGYHWMVCPRF